MNRFFILALTVSALLAHASSQQGSIFRQYPNPNIETQCAVNPLSCHDQDVPILQINVAAVIAAHPDDIETACGGTVAALVSNGTKVHYILVTNGDKGTQNRSMTTAELSAIRMEEQIRAAAVLGVASVDFLGVGDGDVTNSESLQRNLTRLIRKYRPQSIFTWDPALTGLESLYVHGLQHSDHRTTGLATLDVVYPKIRDFLYFPELIDEGFETWHVSQVFLFAWSLDVQNPSSLFTVDISNFFELKAKALLQHRSQIGNPQAEVANLEKMGKALSSATSPRSPTQTYAEWFRRVLFMP